jgi:hypothetical protein
MSSKHSWKKRAPQPTVVSANQVAIDFLLEAYDICNRLNDSDFGDREHRHAYNNAIEALRPCSVFIDTLDKAELVKYIADRVIGTFVVEAATGSVPSDLIVLRLRAEDSV